MEMRERISGEQERHRHEVEAQERREREDASRKQHDLLLMPFDDAVALLCGRRQARENTAVDWLVPMVRTSVNFVRRVVQPDR
jgi:hypothetical protein